MNFYKMTLVLMVVFILSILIACEKQVEDTLQQDKSKINNSIIQGQEIISNDVISIEKAEEIPIISPVIIELKSYCDNSNWQDLSDTISQEMYSYGNHFISTSASSILESDGIDTYYSSNSHDFDLSTAWVEGVLGNGVGERIVYTFNSVLNNNITHIDILNGFMKSDYLWEANSRVKKLRVWLDGNIYAVLMLEDSREMQRFDITPIELYEEKRIEFEILEIYEGNKFDDVAITEIQFCSNSTNINEPKILKQGGYKTTMILENDIEGFFREITQDHITLNYQFTKSANRQSVQDAFEECNSNFSDINISYDWINDYNLDIYLTNLTEGSYNIELKSAKDIENFDFILLSEMWGQNEFSYYGQKNSIKTINIETKEIVDRTEIIFQNYFMYPRSISPYSDNFYYENYNTIDTRFFIPFIYDNSNGWVELTNENRNELYFSYEDEQVYWLSNDLVYINNDIYNIDGNLVKTLVLDGDIVGIIPHIDESQIMVFVNELDEHLKLYILDNNYSEIINTIDLPFNCFITRECNQCHFHDVKYFWLDDETIIIEGWNDYYNEEGHWQQVPSIYMLNILDYSSIFIKDSARLESYLGDNQLLIVDYSSAEINVYYDYLGKLGLRYIFNIENNESTLIDMLNDVLHIDYTYGNYLIYTDKNKLYFYDYINKSHSYIQFESYIYLLGEKDGLLYLDVQG